MCLTLYSTGQRWSRSQLVRLWSLHQQQQHYLGACEKCKYPSKTRPTESEPAVQHNLRNTYIIIAFKHFLKQGNLLFKEKFVEEHYKNK